MKNDDVIRAQYVRTARLGAELSAMLLRDHHGPHLIPASLCGALSHLSEFLPLDAHARGICERLRNPNTFTEVRAALQALTASGDLVSKRGLLETCAKSGSASDDVGVTIRSIAFPTRDREEPLERAVRSYAGNAQTHGRSCEVVVMEASTSPDAQSRGRAKIAEIGRELGISISHGTLREIERYAELLASEAGVPEEVVRYAFALGGPEGIGRPIGANRNALLLHHVGEAFLSADDDTEALIARPPAPRDGVMISAQSAEEVWFFDSREEVLAAIDSWEGCLLGAHERVLGQSFGALARSQRERVELGLLTPTMMRDLADGVGQVALSITGLFGDSAMGDPQAMLLGPGSSTAQRTLRSEEDYRRAMTSREMLKRISPQTRIAPSQGSCMTTSLAFDGTRILPPFCPSGVVEDRLFGLTLSRLPRCYSAFIPCAIYHAPIDVRAYGTVFSRYVDMNDLIEPHLARMPFDYGVGDAASRLRTMGDALVSLGSASQLDYSSYQRDAILKVEEQSANQLSTLLSTSPNAPRWWRAGIEERLSHVRTRATEDAYSVPINFLGQRTPDEARALGQRIIRRFGELLRAWPEIWSAARRLRERGIRIATPAGR